MHDTVSEFQETRHQRALHDNILSYGRRGATTAHVLAEAISDLEGGEACFLFPTALAALASTVLAFLDAGDRLLVVDTVFPAMRKYCEGELRRHGVQIDYFPWDATNLESLVTDKTKAMVMESPASQTYETMDLPALCENAHTYGLTVIADNAYGYGSGWLYRPLELGCDVSVIAGTKYLGGHADLMMGAATACGPACQTLRKHVHISGQTLSPDDAYACLRGMRTLGLRLDRHGENSLAVAKWLLSRDEIVRVLHPALPDHPGHGVWRRGAAQALPPGGAGGG